MRGPTLRELAVQALSSVERGYDLLAPKFDATPFRTPDWMLAATITALREHGPFERGLDVCTGTGVGLELLEEATTEPPTGSTSAAGCSSRPELPTLRPTWCGRMLARCRSRLRTTWW